MRYVVEWDLIPVRGREHPIKRRMIIETHNIGDALLLAEERIHPGQDCVSFRVHEVTDDD